MLNSPQPTLYKLLRQAGTAALSRLEPPLIPSPHHVLCCLTAAVGKSLFVKSRFFSPPTELLGILTYLLHPDSQLYFSEKVEKCGLRTRLLCCATGTAAACPPRPAQPVGKSPASPGGCDTKWKQQIKVKKLVSG